MVRRKVHTILHCKHTYLLGADLEHRQSQEEWTADFEFRASGPERGGGNLQIWYTKDGQAQIGTSSIYTVGKFEGMVLVIDTYGGRVRSNPPPTKP